jgi:hypothetical protein
MGISMNFYLPIDLRQMVEAPQKPQIFRNFLCSSMFQNDPCSLLHGGAEVYVSINRQPSPFSLLLAMQPAKNPRYLCLAMSSPSPM